MGVITKVDIMDQGTDAIDILNNRFHPLRRGYIAVSNRSQKDINENVSVRQGLEKEQVFFFLTFLTFRPFSVHIQDIVGYYQNVEQKCSLEL